MWRVSVRTKPGVQGLADGQNLAFGVPYPEFYVFWG